MGLAAAVAAWAADRISAMRSRSPSVWTLCLLIGLAGFAVAVLVALKVF